MKGRRNEEKNEGKKWEKMKGKERKGRFSLEKKVLIVYNTCIA
jgi:hypothetical protein